MIRQAYQFLQQGLLAKAEQAFKTLLSHNTQDIDALSGLAQVALAKASYKRAYDILVRCLQLDANNYKIYLLLADACSGLTQYDKAELALNKAYELAPKAQPVLSALAVYYCELGDFDKAHQFIELILNQNKTNVQAFGLLVRMSKVALDSNNQQLIDRFNIELYNKNLPITQQVTLHYSFAELNHRAKNYNQAFEHFKKANELQHKQIDFSVADLAPSFNELIAYFNEHFCSEIQTQARNLYTNKKNVEQIIPIFIVGQPRSGSTLLEQMLSGHSEVKAAGELPYLGSEILEGIEMLSGKRFPKGYKKLSVEKRNQLSKYYLECLRAIAPNNKYVVDKMPANFQFIGIIRQLFPQAKIIHITRDARDVSWSIYRNYFAVNEPQFCQLEEIKQYHLLYQRLMSHWQQQFNEDIYQLSYHDLIQSPELEIKQLCQYLGMDFQAECLSFEREKQVIKTLSDVQLRQGIVNKKSPDWLPYQEYLAETFNSLS